MAPFGGQRYGLQKGGKWLLVHLSMGSFFFFQVFLLYSVSVRCSQIGHHAIEAQCEGWLPRLSMIVRNVAFIAILYFFYSTEYDWASIYGPRFIIYIGREYITPPGVSITHRVFKPQGIQPKGREFVFYMNLQTFKTSGVVLRLL